MVILIQKALFWSPDNTGSESGSHRKAWPGTLRAAAPPSFVWPGAERMHPGASAALWSLHNCMQPGRCRCSSFHDSDKLTSVHGGFAAALETG